MISICMIKICSSSICKLPELIFRFCIIIGTFSSVWKKANVVPVHKKVINKFQNISGQYHNFPFAEDILNNYYAMLLNVKMFHSK